MVAEQPDGPGVFVYGTLRAGMGNDRMLPAGAEVRPAVLPGWEMRWAFTGNFGYPVVVPDPGAFVVGEVVAVALSEIPDVARMERGAGYECELLTLGDGTEAWVFTWRRGLARIGDPIPGGDFVEARAARA